MTTMISEVYEALKEAKVSDESARKAAEAIAAYENRFVGLEQRLDRLEQRMEARFNTVNWMVGTCITLVVVSLGSQMAIWARLGEIAARVHS